MATDFKFRLEEVYALRNKELQEKYQRDLPFQDAIFDRWERAAKLGFGEGSSIYNSAFVFGDVKIGKNVWIGPYVILDGSAGELKIGDGCNIASGTQIYTHDTILRTLTGGKAPIRGGNVSIGRNTYIGSQSIINLGVSIGLECVVGANSFVNKSIPDQKIFAGTPAKCIGHVVHENDEIVLKYEKSA